MKKQAILLLLLLGSLGMNAQTAEETSLIKNVDALKQAMIIGDSLSLSKLVMDKLSYGHSSGKIEGKKEFIDNIVSGRSNFVSIDLADQTLIINGKTGIVRHILNAKTMDNGQPGEIHLRVLLVWQKENGRWKLLARQAVKIN